MHLLRHSTRRVAKSLRLGRNEPAGRMNHPAQQHAEGLLALAASKYAAAITIANQRPVRLEQGKIALRELDDVILLVEDLGGFTDDIRLDDVLRQLRKQRSELALVVLPLNDFVSAPDNRANRR